MENNNEYSNILIASNENGRFFTSTDSIIYSSQINKSNLKQFTNEDYTNRYYQLLTLRGKWKYNSLDKTKGVSYPVYEWKRKIYENDWFTVTGSQIEIRCHSNYVYFGSLYKRATDCLTQLFSDGLFIHNSKHEPFSQSFKKSVRKRLIRQWDVSELHFNLVITDKKIGNLLMKDLKSKESNYDKKYDNTVYIKGYHAKKDNYLPILTRVYNTNYKNKLDHVKVEICLRSRYLYENNLRDPSLFTDPITVRGIIRDTIKSELKEVFKRAGFYSSKPMQKKLKDFAGVTNIKNVYDELLKDDWMLSEIIKKRSQERYIKNSTDYRKVVSFHFKNSKQMNKWREANINILALTLFCKNQEEVEEVLQEEIKKRKKLGIHTNELW